VFVARPVQLDRRAVVRLATMTERQVRSHVANDEALIEKR
jgi:hypothetical protein